MKMTTVKFCKNNFLNGKEEIAEKLKQNYKDVEVIVGSCLGFCSDCANVPYALVDDEYVEADTTEELYEKITKHI